MKHQTNSDQMIPQADKEAHTHIAERAGRDRPQASAKGSNHKAHDSEHKTASDEMIPQADKQAHTEMAERAGRETDKQP